MFEAFYELTATPFSRDIPVDELLVSTETEELLGRMDYAAHKQLFMVITGDCGTGKTTLVRKFQAMLDPGAFTLLYLADSKLTPRHFYKGLLTQLGVEARFYRGDAKRQLHREIELMRGIHHRRPVVVVDEAHLLDREMLEEVRFLLNFRMDAESPMALLLVGQNELWDKLQLQSYTAIRQRIDLQSKLYHMDRAQVGEYVKRHLAYAGTSNDIFSDSALDEVFSLSSGAARMVNKLCTHCLLYGSQNGKRIIDDRMVKRVADGKVA
jgi:type II secretory pathway predicted ATPase ExeA